MPELSAAERLNTEPGIHCLRTSIRENRIHFPVPVPVFSGQYRPDIQWRLVELYFIRGWSAKKIAERYGVTARRIQQSLQHWADKAMERGYLQAIPPETVLAAPRPVPAPAYPIPESTPFMPIPVTTLPSGLAAHAA
jgi:hypothetical protein